MFSGKVAIVTGGSRGIGRAIVQALAREGARVVFTYVQNKALADEIANGDTIVGFQADVTSFEQAKSLVKQVKERFGRIDVLVNNAGITRDKLINATSLSLVMPALFTRISIRPNRSLTCLTRSLACSKLVTSA